MQIQRRPALEALRRARVDAGLTISELAKRADVSRDTISNAERGRHSLQGPTLSKIASALGALPSELLAEEERLSPKARSSLGDFPDVLGMGEEELEGLRARARREDAEGTRLYTALTRAQEAAWYDRRRLAEAVEAGHPSGEELDEAYERDRALFKLWRVVLYERQRPFINDHHKAKRKPEAPIYPDTTALPLEEAYAEVHGSRVPVVGR